MWLLIMISPLLLAALVLAAVTITALIRARPEDVPTVTSTFVSAFAKLVERVRITPPGRGVTPPAATELGSGTAATPMVEPADGVTSPDAALGSGTATTPM